MEKTAVVPGHQTSQSAIRHVPTLGPFVLADGDGLYMLEKERLRASIKALLNNIITFFHAQLSVSKGQLKQAHTVNIQSIINNV